MCLSGIVQVNTPRIIAPEGDPDLVRPGFQARQDNQDRDYQAIQDNRGLGGNSEHPDLRSERASRAREGNPGSRADLVIQWYVGTS